MYRRRIVSLTLILLSFNAISDDYVCGLDINGNGALTEQNEIAFCESTISGGHSCPLKRLECIEQTTEVERCDINKVELPFFDVYQSVCKASDQSFIGSTRDDALEQCLSNCDDETTFINPNTGEECKTNIGSENSPLFVFDTLQCHLKQPIHTSQEDETFIEDTDTSSEECTNLEIFSGASKKCRTNGYQTRWDNCCNNGEKIITDSFSESTTEEKLEGMGEMVGGFIDTISGTSAGSEMHKLVSEIFVTVPKEIDPTRLAGMVGNWIQTPCSKDSESVMMMASGLCHKIGKKCIEKWDLVGCVQSAQVHCCYKTKLARIFHEQVKAQIAGQNWGTVNEPNCKGLTPEQFQSIDFSKLDFTEYFDDVQHESTDNMQNEMKETLSSLDLMQ